MTVYGINLMEQLFPQQGVLSLNTNNSSHSVLHFSHTRHKENIKLNNIKGIKFNI